jgi:hypothetical protein
MRRAIPPLLQYASWRGVQLKKRKFTSTFFLGEYVERLWIGFIWLRIGNGVCLA